MIHGQALDWMGLKLCHSFNTKSGNYLKIKWLRSGKRNRALVSKVPARLKRSPIPKIWRPLGRCFRAHPDELARRGGRRQKNNRSPEPRGGGRPLFKLVAKSREIEDATQRLRRRVFIVILPQVGRYDGVVAPNRNAEPLGLKYINPAG